jgi:hypothetical protein
MEVITKNNTFTVQSSDGKFNSFDSLRKLKKPGLKFSFKNCDTSFTCSTDHLWYYDDNHNFRSADEFIVGDWVSHEKFGYLCISKIEELDEIIVYDLVNVDNEQHSYLTDGFISHNCEFQGASNTLIPGEILLDLNSRVEEPIAFKYGLDMRIYEEPQPGEEYVLGVDPSEGLGGDHGVVQVLKVVKKNKEGEHYKFAQVAVFSNNTTIPRNFSQIAIGIGRYYNDAWMMVEGNNACGALTCHHIWYEYEYENMINPDKAKKKKLGILATAKTKQQMCIKIVDLFAMDQIKVVDRKTIEEFNTFEEISPGRYAAAGNGAHDDHVTSLMWGTMFVDTKYFDGYQENYGSEISAEFDIPMPSFRNASKPRNQSFSTF